MSEEKLEFAWHAAKRRLDETHTPYDDSTQYFVDQNFPAYYVEHQSGDFWILTDGSTKHVPSGPEPK